MTKSADLKPERKTIAEFVIGRHPELVVEIMQRHIECVDLPFDWFALYVYAIRIDSAFYDLVSEVFTIDERVKLEIRWLHSTFRTRYQITNTLWEHYKDCGYDTN